MRVIAVLRLSLSRHRYQLLSPEGHLLGYLAEEDLGLRGALTRNMLKTHRAFRATVLAPDGTVLLRVSLDACLSSRKRQY